MLCILYANIYLFSSAYWPIPWKLINNGNENKSHEDLKLKKASTVHDTEFDQASNYLCILSGEGGCP